MEAANETIRVPVGTTDKPFSITVTGEDLTGKTLTGRFKKPDGTVENCTATVDSGDSSKINLTIPTAALDTTGEAFLVVWIDDGAGHKEPTHPPIRFLIEETVPYS